MKTIKFKKLIKYFFGIFVLLACAEDQPQTIPIIMERNNTILPVVVGGIGPLKILFDTGLAFDGLMIYNPDLKDSIKLDNVIEVKIPGAGSGEPSTAIMDDSASFFVGDIEFKNQKVIILENNIYKGFPTDGIIGYSILGHYATEIDYDTKLITLHEPENFSPNDSWQSIPIYIKDNPIPWIDVSVSIEGEDLTKISTYIDLADGDAIVLLEKDVMKFSLPKETKEILLGRGLSGDIYGKEGKISKLKIGSFELNEVTTKIAPAEVRSKQAGADAVIGNDVLRRFNLIFDYRHKLLYIKPNKYFDVKFE
jgi:hypothetical protein